MSPRATRRKPLALALALSAIVALAGCAGPAEQPDRPRPAASAPARAAPGVNLSGFSAEFKEGYADGCAQRRNEARYAADDGYARGWRDGNAICKR